MLCFDLDNTDVSIDLLHQVFSKCLQELHLDSADISNIATRTSSREVQLIIMRFLSVLMSRSKAGGKSSSQVRSKDHRQTRYDFKIRSLIFKQSLSEYIRVYS